MKLIIEIASLGSVYCLETFYPLFKDRAGRLPHGARNLSMGLVNAAVTQLFFAGLIASAALWTEDNRFGILRPLGLPGILQTILLILLFDGWMYLWHRANHETPFLWRFHRTHHSDLELDCTSALRFHAGEICLSHLARLLVIPLLGVGFSELMLYEIFLQPVIIFHHSNVDFPEKWDRLIRTVIVSPNLHRVHHSKEVLDTNSNYSSIFSFWDRLWKTLREKENPGSVTYGLPDFREEEWQTVPGMLRTPFGSK